METNANAVGRRVQDVIDKIAATGGQEALLPEENAVLAAALGVTEPILANTPRPLWAHLERQVARLGSELEADEDYDLEALTEFLPGARAGAESSPMALLSTPVTADELRARVGSAIAQTDAEPEVRATAMRLAGEAGFSDLAATIASQLDDDEDDEVVVAGLRALAILGAPADVGLTELADHDDSDALQYLVLAMLGGGHAHAAEALRLSLAEELTVPFAVFGERLAALAPETDLDEDALLSVAEDAYELEECRGIAKIILARGSRTLVKKALAGDSWRLRQALGLELAWSEQTWAADAVNDHLDDEDDDDARMALAAALGTLVESDSPYLRDHITLNSPDCAAAVWACLGRPEMLGLVRPLLEDEDTEDTVRRAAMCVLAATEAPIEQARVTVAWAGLAEAEDSMVAVAVRAVEAKGVPAPPSLRLKVMLDKPLWTEAEYDEAATLTARCPEALVADEDELDARRASLLIASGSSEGRLLLENALLAMDDEDVARAAALQLVAVGGPTSLAGRLFVRALSLPDEEDATLELSPEEVPAAMMLLAGRRDDAIRPVLIRSLARHPELEEIMLALLSSDDDATANAAATTLADMAGATSPLAAQVRRVFAGGQPDAAFLPQLVASRAFRLRAALATCIASMTGLGAAQGRYLQYLALDDDRRVRAAARAGLASLGLGGMPKAFYVVGEDGYADEEDDDGDEHADAFFDELDAADDYELNEDAFDDELFDDSEDDSE